MADDDPFDPICPQSWSDLARAIAACRVELVREAAAGRALDDHGRDLVRRLGALGDVVATRALPISLAVDAWRDLCSQVTTCAGATR